MRNLSLVASTLLGLALDMPIAKAVDSGIRNISFRDNELGFEVARQRREQIVKFLQHSGSLLLHGASRYVRTTWLHHFDHGAYNATQEVLVRDELFDTSSEWLAGVIHRMLHPPRDFAFVADFAELVRQQLVRRRDLDSEGVEGATALEFCLHDLRQRGDGYFDNAKQNRLMETTVAHLLRPDSRTTRAKLFDPEHNDFDRSISAGRCFGKKLQLVRRPIYANNPGSRKVYFFDADSHPNMYE